MSEDEKKSQTNARGPKLHAVLVFVARNQTEREEAVIMLQIQRVIFKIQCFYDDDSLTAFSFMVPAIFLPIS
jgi:hypothetical protein